MNNKSFFNRLLLSFKKASNIPILPESITHYYNHIIARILRFVGGICTLTTLTSKTTDYTTLNYIIFSLATIHLLSIFTISMIKIVYGINILIKHKSDFEVRNSPLDSLMTKFTKLAYCWKIGCTVGIGVGTLNSHYRCSIRFYIS